MTMPRRLTVLAVNTLFAASRSSSGVRVSDLVDATMRFTGRSLNAARARVSGTCRALWRAGLLELHGRRDCDGTLTDKQRELHAIAARAAANPDEFYRTAVALRGDDPYGSASACLEAKRQMAARLPRFHAHRVRITALGRERLEATIGGT